MVWTAELWNLPESVPHEIVIKSLPVLNVSFENGIGTDGSARMAVPANYTRLDEICDGSADVQGLVRLYWDGEHAFSFFPDNRGKKYEEETGTLVDISGEGVASAMKWAVAFPYDYPAKPYKTFNHTYGGEGSDGGFSNGGAEDFNLNGGAESGTISPFQPTQTDSNFITPLSFQVSSAHVHTGSNSFYVIPNGIRSGFKLSYPVMPGESYEFSAYLKDPLASGFRYIMLIELGEDSTMVQGAGIWNGYAVVELGAAAYEGGASDGLWQTLYGEVLFGPDVNQTTVYFVYDDPVVGGGGSEFYVDEIVVAGPGVGLHPWIPLGFLDEFSQSPFVSRTGDNSILFRVNASSPLGGTGGMQKLTNLVVGKTYTFSGYTQHDGVTAQPIRMVARYPGWPEGEGPILGSMLHSIPTGIVDWTYIWVTFVATHPDIWVDWRYDAAGASPNFWFDDMAFGEGLAKDTIGKIYKDMMDDAVIDHAAEVAPGEPRVVLPWLDYSSFTTLLDSAGVDWDEKVSLTMPMGQNYSQMNNQTRRLGYELDVVPDGLDAWQLVIYNPNGMGTDYSLAATPGVVVGQGIDSGQFASLVRPANHVLGIGAEGIWSEQERAPSKVTLGRREFFVADLQTLDETTVIKKADETLSSFEKTSDGFKLTFNESTPTVPFIDYTYGDIVNVHLPSYGINGPYRVHKIHGDWANAGESTWTVDFGSEVVTVGGSTAVAVQKILQRFEPLSEPKISSGAGVTTEAGRGGVDPTFLVAAVNAAPHIRANADFRCSGSNDQREIQAAFDALPVAGGRVQLSEGTFSITSTATPVITMPDNSELVGAGAGTLLSISGFGTAIRNVSLLSMYDLRIANLRMDTSNVTGGFVGISLAGAATVEGCWFTGAGQSTQDVSYLYFGASGLTTTPIVSHCHFYDVYDGGASSAVIAVLGLSVVVDGCSFYGTDGGYAVWHDTGINGMVISGCFIDGCQVYATSGDLTVSGCVFNTVSAGETASIVVDDMLSLSITGCTFDGETAGSRIVTPGGNAEWHNTVISGNTFHGGWVNLGAGEIRGLVISNNVLYGRCDVLFDSPTATFRALRDIEISGNIVAEASESATARIHFLGVNLSVQNLTIAGNTLTSNSQAAATSMIDLQFTADEQDNGQAIRVIDNLVEFRLGNDDGYAIRVRGRTGSTHGHVVVANNMLRAAGAGVLIDDVRDVVVSNNVQGITTDGSYQKTAYSNQLTISGAGTAVVDGNKWIAGEAADGAGTGAVMYVEATVGAVRNNDIWGKEVGAMNTALKYSAGLVESGNVYHGLHSSQTGSVLTNGIVGQASGSGGTASVGFTGTATGAVV